MLDHVSTKSGNVTDIQNLTMDREHVKATHVILLASVVVV